MKLFFTAIVFSFILGCSSSTNAPLQSEPKDNIQEMIYIKGELKGLLKYENQSTSIPWEPNLTFDDIIEKFGGRTPFTYYVTFEKKNGDKFSHRFSRYLKDDSIPRVKIETGMKIDVKTEVF